jgi:glycosyltransferase involved in cell wall biosynthesis
MKVAQIVCVFPPYGGGLGTVAKYYAEELAKQGHEVTVFTPNVKNKCLENARYKVVFLHPLFRIGLGAFLPQLLWRLRKFDIIHLHYPFFGAALFVCLLKKIKGKKMKFVLNYHMDVAGSGLKKWFFDFYRKFVQKPIVKSADKILVGSYDYLEDSDVKEIYKDRPGRFYELKFGVSEEFSPQKKNPSLMKKYNINLSDRVIGFVGGLDSAHYFKGINYLITAFSKITKDNSRLLIVGEGNLKVQYMDLAKKLGVDKRVVFSGYVPQLILPEHYNLFDIFVLPSIDRSEAFGLVLVEAMACGKPLVASYLKGVRSVVEAGENGLLVEPKNIQDLADKITYLLEHEDLMKQFGANGIEIANQKYRWPVIVSQLDKIYQEL